MRSLLHDLHVTYAESARCVSTPLAEKMVANHWQSKMEKRFIPPKVVCCGRIENSNG